MDCVFEIQESVCIWVSVRVGERIYNVTTSCLRFTMGYKFADIKQDVEWRPCEAELYPRTCIKSGLSYNKYSLYVSPDLVGRWLTWGKMERWIVWSSPLPWSWLSFSSRVTPSPRLCQSSWSRRRPLLWHHRLVSVSCVLNDSTLTIRFWSIWFSPVKTGRGV